MRSFSAPALLSVWDRGQALGATERALAMLAAATPRATEAELAGLSLDERDRRLAAIHAAEFVIIQIQQIAGQL